MNAGSRRCTFSSLHVPRGITRLTVVGTWLTHFRQCLMSSMSCDLYSRCFINKPELP
jgi:hypothetical protein